MSHALKILAFGLLLVTAPAFAAESGDSLNDLTPLAHDTLSSYAGGSGISNASLSTITSTVTDNSIGNVGYTGDISNNVSSGNSGLTTQIFNSGNQVSISQSTIVNVFLH